MIQVADGYQILAEMLTRVEANLELLKSCRETSLAAASGSKFSYPTAHGTTPLFM